MTTDIGDHREEVAIRRRNFEMDKESILRIATSSPFTPKESCHSERSEESSSTI